MPKTIILDFDGTIADSYAVGIDLYNYAAKISRAPVLTKEVADKLKKFSAKQIIKKHITWWKMPYIVFLMKRKMIDMVDKLKPFPKIKELLRELKKEGYSLAILSSNQKKVIESFLNKEDLNIFDEVMISGGIFNKAKSLKRYLKNKNLDLKDTVYIGDEVRDIDACKKVGMQIISVSWGLNDKEPLEKANPGMVVDNQKDLLEKIKELV
jgi:phosphoglycolate phosphatase